MTKSAAPRFRVVRSLVTFGVAVACAGVLLVLAPWGHPLVLGAQLTSATDFTVNGSVSNLAPGVASPLTLDFGNPYTNIDDAITVTSVMVTVTTDSASCPADSNLALTYNSSTDYFSGSPPTASVTYAVSQTVIQPNTPSSGPGTYTNTAISILLLPTASNTKCQNVTYQFSYSAMGSYEDGTTVSLTPSPAPAVNTGQSVTFTATVTPSESGESPSPTGTVTFYNGSTVICTDSSSSSPSTFNGTTASCTTSFPAAGTYPISAQYSGDSDYDGNTSNTVQQVVNSSTCGSSIATTGTTVYTITGTYGGNYTVLSGKILYLDGGTITGNVTVNSGGSLVTSGGTIQGNLTSSGGTIEFQGATTVNGNIQATDSQFVAAAGTLIRGNLSVTGDSVFCSLGTSTQAVTIQGNVSVQSLSNGATIQYICSTTVNGNVSYEDNGSTGIIGGTSTCGGNTIGGNLTITSNTGPLTIGNNKVNGNIAIQSNTAAVTITSNNANGTITVSGNLGGTMTSNSANGTCSLSGDNPKITASGNTAKGTNTCDPASGSA